MFQLHAHPNPDSSIGCAKLSARSLIQKTVNHPEENNQSFNDEKARFRVWRLLGVIAIVVVVLAVAAATVDILVIGPLDGRL